MSFPFRLALMIPLALPLASTLSAQTLPPTAVPDPIAIVAAGTGVASTSTCLTGTMNTAGTNLGDGCTPAAAGLAAPQGVSVDKLGNLYIADYTDRQLRVVYKAGAQLAAAITAANSGYAISSTRNAPATVPVAGNIYTLAGLGASPAALSATSGSGAYYCASYAATNQPTALNSLGDGCPAASAPTGPRAVQPDADGNLFLVDYTNSRIRIFCVNCAATTAAAKLITLENPGVTPVNGAMYTVAGYAGGYRDAAPGFNSATAATVNVALLRSPTSVSISPTDDLYIGDQGNNAVRLLYNGGAQALALLTAEGVSSPTVGYVYTIVGAGCVSAALGKTGSVTTANSCRTPTSSADGTLGTSNGVDTPWSVFLDSNQNLYYGDSGNSLFRVLYGGVANPVPLSGALTKGAVYSIAGAGSSTANGIPAAQLALAATAAQGITGDASGNLFLVDYVRNVIYELYASTGTLTAIVGSSTPNPLASGAACSILSSSNTFGDSCPATFSKLNAPRGGVAVDTNGNLYFGDSSDNIVQKYTYANPFASTAVGSTASMAQSIAFTFNAASTPSSIAAAPADFSVATGSDCTAAQTAGGTCTASVQFTPTAPGLREGAASVLGSGSTVLGSELLAGLGTGAALSVDQPSMTTLGSGLQPNATAIDASGRLLVADLTSKSVLRYASVSATTAATLATGFIAPSGLAVDGAGNIYIADSIANIVRELPINGNPLFTLVTGLNAPHGLAVDQNGNLLIANTGSSQILQVTPNGTVPAVVAFSGLSAPQGVAVDGAGNIYAADTGNARIVRLAPSGAQTVIANVSSAGVVVDAGGNVLAFSGTSLNQYPSGAQVFTGVSTPRALAIDAYGNLAVADQSATGLLALNRTVPAYTFTTNPSSNIFTLTSSGNTVFVPSTPFLSSTDTTHFTVAPSSSNGCSGTLAPGAACNINATFSSATAATFTTSVSFNGNLSHAVGLALTGTNTAEGTTTTFAASPTSFTYGTAVTFTATVKGTSTTPTSGTVSFRNATTTLGTANVGTNGTASTSIVLPAGTQGVTATFAPGNVNYASSTSAATTFTVTPAVLTATANNASRQYGVANPMFTYTLTGFVNSDNAASATSGTPTETTTATSTSAQGTYPITITQGTLAAANYTFAFKAGTLTVTAAVPAVTLTSTATSIYGGSPVTFTSNVTSTVGSPTGSVKFFSGTTLLSQVTLNAGAATLTTTALPIGVDSITAVYSGDTAFASTTSSATIVNVGVPFGITASSTALTFPHNYQEAQSVLTINPGGRTDTLTFSCSGLPAKISCTFTPSTLVLTGLSGPQTVTLLVSNSNAQASVMPIQHGTAPISFAVGLAAVLLITLRRRRNLAPLLGLLMFAIALTALTGCGSNTASTQQASGAYPFTVTVNSGTTTVQTLSYTLTIQ